MSLQSEVDAKVMENYATATIEDLQRGIYTAVKQSAREGLQSKQNEWLHLADLLRQELQKRQGAMQ